MSISPLTGIGSAGVGGSGIGDYGLGGNLGYCELLSWTPSLQTNSSGAFSGSPAIRLTVTNDGGGAGTYVTSGSPSWTSATGSVSFECRFISSSANTSTGGIYLVQGVTEMIGLIYFVQTGVLYDFIGATNVATGLTGGENYTFGFKLNQAAGTCTFSDSEGNSGSLTVNGAYSNATASFFSTASNTAVSEVHVHEVNAHTEAFWLPASQGGYCDYI